MRGLEGAFLLSHYFSLGYSYLIHESFYVPREFIKRYTPDAEKVKQHKSLQFLGGHLHACELWHLNRYSIARGFATGLFWSLIPLPMQMAGAAITALLWRANMPISIALVWITNPLTIVPVFYLLYLFGASLLGVPTIEMPEGVSIEWFRHSIEEIWQPLLLGSVVCATVVALIGYYGIHLLWRILVLKRWKNRKPRIKL